MTLIDGRGIAAAIIAQTRDRTESLRAAGIVPTLAVVVGSAAPGSASYLRGLARASERAGVKLVVQPAPARRDGVLHAVDVLAARSDVHGILVQTPLPQSVDPAAIAERIPVDKDVDGMSPALIGRLAAGRVAQPPATAAAVLEILQRSRVELPGTHAVVIGSGAVAGRPIALLLLAADATVTVCHAATRDVAALSREADVLVSAAGRPHLVDRRYVKPGAVVVDVGINDVGGSIVGDVDTHDVLPLVRAITPVPGGVGPVTSAVLLRNTVAAVGAQGLLSAGRAHGRLDPPAAAGPGSSG